jgi:hypothetical protein
MGQPAGSIAVATQGFRESDHALPGAPVRPAYATMVALLDQYMAAGSSRTKVGGERWERAGRDGSPIAILLAAGRLPDDVAGGKRAFQPCLDAQTSRYRGRGGAALSPPWHTARRHYGNPAMCEGVRTEGANGQHELGASCADTLAGDRRPERWRLSSAGQSRWQRGASSASLDASAAQSQSRRIRGALGRPSCIDGASRLTLGSVPAVRHCSWVPYGNIADYWARC